MALLVVKEHVARFILATLLTSACISGTHAQVDSSKVDTYQGVIQSHGKGIDYASIYVEGSNQGTISNAEGFFTLKLPAETDASKFLIVSCISYETRRIKLSELNRAFNIIELTEASTELPEVVISLSNDSAMIYLTQAIDHIKDNYPRKRHILESFYRELSVRDTIFTRLIEAAIVIDEPAYRGNHVKEDNLTVDDNRIKVIEMRKSDDNREYDLLGWTFTKIFGEKNDMYAVLDDNYIRFIGKKNDHFLSKDFLNEYLVSVVDRTSFEGNPVIVLNLTSKDHSSFFLRDINIYVSKTDFGILKFENNLLVNPSKKELTKFGIDQKYFYQSTATYRKIDGSYYPQYILTRKYASNTNPLKEDMLQYTILELFVTATHINDDYEKIKARHTVSRNKDVNNIEARYNPEFWENYNTVQLNPISKKAKRDLQSKITLEEQYKKQK